MTYEVPHKDYIVMTAKPRNDVLDKSHKHSPHVIARNKATWYQSHKGSLYVIARSEATWQSTDAKVERKFWKGVKKEKNVV